MHILYYISSIKPDDTLISCGKMFQKLFEVSRCNTIGLVYNILKGILKTKYDLNFGLSGQDCTLWNIHTRTLLKGNKTIMSS